MPSNLSPWGGTGQMSEYCLCTYLGGLWEGNFRPETIQIVGCLIAGYWPQIFSHIWMADVCVILSVGVSFCFFLLPGRCFFYEHLRWGSKGCWVQQVGSNSIAWSSLKLFKENNFPFSLLNANSTLAFENLSLLRYLAGVCGILWRWAEYFSSCRVLCSHSNGETLLPCTGTCMIHS